MTQFKTGDIVQLKSGGPKMTVKTAKKGEVTCTWFSGSKQQSGWFDPDTLKKIEEPT